MIVLDVCPCCGAGIKFTRGWTWIQPTKALGDHVFTNDRGVIDGDPNGCDCDFFCPICWPSKHFGDDGRAGLLWIGESFYKTPADFLREGAQMGISRRISAIPRGFELGKTWIYFAHKKAHVEPVEFGKEPEFKPGIFSAFRPQRIERIVLESELETWSRGRDILADPDAMGDAQLSDILSDPDFEIFKRLQSDVDRGISLVPVPDDDPDHNRKK